MFNIKMNKKMLQQNYAAYTEEDFLVWKTLFERQMINLSNTATSAYLEGINKIGFSAGRIPDFREVNKALGSLTGWSLQAVPGIIPEKEFFELLHQKKFSASTWLRKMSQLDYLEEPDMFHDVFGHVPLLTNPYFCGFFEKLSHIALKHSNNARVIEMLGRIYWFTVEFGLIREKEGLKIYGAGIMSSAGETKFCVSDKPAHLPYNARKVMNTAFFNDRIQDKYFVIDSFEQLYESVGEILLVVEEEVQKAERVYLDIIY